MTIGHYRKLEPHLDKLRDRFAAPSGAQGLNPNPDNAHVPSHRVEGSFRDPTESSGHKSNSETAMKSLRSESGTAVRAGILWERS